MKLLRKILAILAIIFAVVFLIASLAGVGGVWVIRARVNTAITNLFDLADNSIARLTSGIDEVINLSNQVGGATSAMEATVETLGAKIDETPVILLAVDALFDGKLIPGLEKFNQSAQKFYGSLVQLQTITTSLNTSFLFNRRDSALDEIDQFLTDFISTLDQLNQNAGELRSGVQEAKSETTERVIGRLTQPLERIGTLMSNVQTRLIELNTNLSELQVRLDTTEANIIRLITLVVVLISLILLWIVFSQYIVIRWALSYYKSASLTEGASAEMLPSGENIPEEKLPESAPGDQSAPPAEESDQSQVPPAEN